MLKKKNIKHPLLGTVVISYDTRARRIIMRARPDAIYITVPTQATEIEIERVLAEYGSKLKEQQEKLLTKHIGKDFLIDRPHVKLHLQEGGVDEVTITGSNGIYTLYYPLDTDFGNNDTQKLLRRAIIAALQHRAKQILPPRLRQLSINHNLHYKRVTVRDSHTRWGSCGSNGTISLSIYLVLLPQHLIDYVLRHELCHTVEMNHSPRFWMLLDTMCGTSSKMLRDELKQYSAYI